MGVGRLFLRFGGTVLCFIELCCAVIIMSIWAWFVHEFLKYDNGVSDRYKAILGLSSAATLWTLLGVIFTLCLGSVRFFSMIGIVLDLLFMGAFIWVSYTLRAGKYSCGNGDFFYYNGPEYNNGYDYNNGNNNFFGVSTHGECELYRTSFAFAIILTVLFFISAIWQGLMMKRGDRAPRKSSV